LPTGSADVRLQGARCQPTTTSAQATSRPWFTQRSFGNPNYIFDTAAGRHVVLCFYASASDPHALAAIEAAQSRSAFFDDKTACFFGVSLDSKDETE
jgi:peroxiredoxin